MSGSAVLDTNVVLELLFFDDPGTQLLSGALRSGRVTWWACAQMRDELENVIARPGMSRYASDGAAVLAAFDARARLLPLPVAPGHGLRCRDADDQCFIDLALGHRARWLLSHDRDLLALAPRARRLGLVICSPRAWAASSATSADRSSPAVATRRS